MDKNTIAVFSSNFDILEQHIKEFDPLSTQTYTPYSRDEIIAMLAEFFVFFERFANMGPDMASQYERARTLLRAAVNLPSIPRPKKD